MISKTKSQRFEDLFARTLVPRIALSLAEGCLPKNRDLQLFCLFAGAARFYWFYWIGKHKALLEGLSICSTAPSEPVFLKAFVVLIPSSGA